METLLLILGLLAAAWFALLMRRPRSRRTPDPDGFAVDPALSKALDQGFADNNRRATY
jgi:hypothetical protein